METMKKRCMWETVIHVTWRNCIRGFWWCHNTDIFIYLICGKGLQGNSVQCTVCICWKGVCKNFERAEIQMIRWMCDVSMKDRRTSEELIKLIGVELITTVIRSGRLYSSTVRTQL